MEGNDETDCYFCLTKTTGFNNNNKCKIPYPDVSSVTKPVPYPDSVPYRHL